jgi:hypothetical protein
MKDLHDVRNIYNKESWHNTEEVIMIMKKRREYQI